MTWQVQTAKQRFSELVERAVSEGPQVVTKHGRETVVVLEIGEYRRLLGVPMDFKEFLMSMPPDPRPGDRALQGPGPGGRLLTYLPDTNVLSELRRPAPSSSVVAWFAETEPSELYLSVLVVGEIRQRRSSASAPETLREATVTRSGSERSETVRRPDPRFTARSRSLGSAPRDGPLPVVDSLLAATALVHGLVVVTRDTRPFERVGVPWLDPWAA